MNNNNFQNNKYFVTWCAEKDSENNYKNIFLVITKDDDYPWGERVTDPQEFKFGCMVNGIDYDSLYTDENGNHLIKKGSKEWINYMNDPGLPCDKYLRVAAINRLLNRCSATDKDENFALNEPIDNNKEQSYPPELKEAIEYLTGQGENGKRVIDYCSETRSKFKHDVDPALFDEFSWFLMITPLLQLFYFCPELKEWSIKTFVNIYPMMPEKHVCGVIGNLLKLCESLEGRLDLSDFLNAATATILEIMQAN